MLKKDFLGCYLQMLLSLDKILRNKLYDHYAKYDHDGLEFLTMMRSLFIRNCDAATTQKWINNMRDV